MKENLPCEQDRARNQNFDSSEREQRSGSLRTPIHKLIEVQTPYQKLNTNFTLGADGELHHSMDNNFPVMMMKQNYDSGFDGLNSTNNLTGCYNGSKKEIGYNFGD